MRMGLCGNGTAKGNSKLQNEATVHKTCEQEDGR